MRQNKKLNTTFTIRCPATPTTKMTSRKERTSNIRSAAVEEWHNYWFENIILKNLEPEQLTNTHANTFLWVVITRNQNTTIELIESYINLPWRWDIVCHSLIRSMDFVERYIGSSFLVWSELSQNTNLSLDDIERNIHLPWDWKTISSRDDITIDFAKRHFNKLDANILSQRANLWEDINENPQNYSVLSAIHNPNITLDFIERHFEVYKTHDLHLNMRRIAPMKIATLDFIEKHIDVMHGSWLSSNPNLTIEFMRKYPDKDWRMSTFSRHNPTVTPELVINNLSFGWNWEMLSTRSNFSPREHPEFPWDWEGYSRNDNFDFNCVPTDKLCELDWSWISQSLITVSQIIKYSAYISWTQLTINEHITMSMIRKTPELHWSYDFVHANPNCDLAMFEKKGEIYINQIAGKSLGPDREAFIERRFREHLSAYRIQQRWVLARTDPNYELCRKKLEADWEAYSVSNM